MALIHPQSEIKCVALSTTQRYSVFCHKGKKSRIGENVSHLRSCNLRILTIFRSTVAFSKYGLMVSWFLIWHFFKVEQTELQNVMSS